MCLMFHHPTNNQLHAKRQIETKVFLLLLLSQFEKRTGRPLLFFELQQQTSVDTLVLGSWFLVNA